MSALDRRVTVSGRENLADWRDLREFHQVDFEASYVLGWKLYGEMLAVDLDLRLEPGHAFYEPPRPAEKVCIRPAVLEFPDCDSVALKDEGPSTDTGALVAALGVGLIDGLVVFDDGVYELSGKFGTVVIHSGRLVLRLTGA
jgi:hypothetical protein